MTKRCAVNFRPLSKRFKIFSATKMLNTSKNMHRHVLKDICLNRRCPGIAHKYGSRTSWICVFFVHFGCSAWLMTQSYSGVCQNIHCDWNQLQINSMHTHIHTLPREQTRMQEKRGRKKHFVWNTIAVANNSLNTPGAGMRKVWISIDETSDGAHLTHRTTNERKYDDDDDDDGVQSSAYDRNTL